MDLINQACDTLSFIKKRKARYDVLNETLKALQGDFAMHFDGMDCDIEAKVIKLLDNILGAELASYWLYECCSMPNGGKITDNGKTFRIKSIGDVKRYARYLSKMGAK